jgi:hypothetical protein
MSHELSDEIFYLDVGYKKPREFFTFDMPNLSLSYDDNFDERYKIAGLTVFRSFDVEMISRNTYDFLSLLGDVGGLDAVLIIVGFLMINWFQQIAQNCYFMSFLYFYRKEPAKTFDIDSPNLKSNIESDIINRSYFEPTSVYSILKGLLCC